MIKNKIKTIIVDDEKSARDYLRYIVNKHFDFIEVVGEADRLSVAIEQIKKTKPDLVFLDIEMPQQNGFQLFSYFENIDFQVVFVTAYDEYALKAFEVAVVDYLLKPIELDRIKSVMDKVLKRKERKNSNDNIKVLKENMASLKLKKMSIPFKGNFVTVEIPNIMLMEAQGSYTNFTISVDGTGVKEYLYAQKLGYFVEKLPVDTFLRVHRSWFINIDYVKNYSKKDRNIELLNNLKIPVGKSFKNNVEEVLFL